MSVFFTSCGGQKKDLPKEKIKSETKDKVTSYGSNEKGIDTKYECTESNSERLIIQTGFQEVSKIY